VQKVIKRTNLNQEEEKRMQETFGETREETIEKLKKAEEQIKRGEYMEWKVAFKKLREKYGF